ncbi:PAS domain S-box protein [Natrinema salinisoli]|uniref:PAS domain S-box protein n=1 Tax=Natrinema salinisoli TaxID=2878535 RepID=UPI001CEFFEEE|nr:PAS domain S-box protein [Natrinema salinisoli]
MGTNIGPTTRIVAVDSGSGGAVERVLDGTHTTVDVVETADACLETLSSDDCVVIGDTRSDTDPVECCRTIRDRGVENPIVVYPADGSEALAGAVVAAGADGYVPRSEGVETLTKRLRELTADRSSGDRSADTPATGPSVTDATLSESTADPTDRLESFVDRLPLAVVEWTLEYEIRDWNSAATELFGYTADEAIGDSAFELIVPEHDRDTVLQWRDRIVDGDSVCWVNPNVCKDGTTITCEWVNTPLVDDDGDVVSVLSFVRDVTDEHTRASALEALQETTQELLRAESANEIADIVMTATEDVLDQSLAGIRLYDEDSETLELASTTTTFDEHTDEIPSVGPGSTIFWEAYADQMPTIVENVPMERIPYDVETEIGNVLFQPLGDHGLFTVAASGDETFGDAEIHLLHVLASTAEAALDRAARERELERTKTVVEAVGDCVYQLDSDGRFVTVNDTRMGEIDYDRDDLLGEHVSKILTDESLERGQRQVQALVDDDEQRVATYEVTLTGPDGERTPGEVNMALLRSDGEIEGTVGIARDISDRKRMERKLVDRKAKIEALHEVASRLDDCTTREEVYEETVEAAEDVLNFDVCCVDSVRGEYLVKQAISSTLDVDLDEEMPIGDGIAGKTYRTQQPYRVDDILADDDAAPKVDGLRSVLSVPIDDRGVFQAVSTEPSAFTPADTDLAELLLSHVTDALDRIEFEKRLRTERDRFVALFENVPDAVVSVSRLEDGPITEDVNPAFERIFGFDEAELVGEPLDDFIVPPDRTTEADTLNRRGSHGEIGEAEVKRQTADGLRDFRLRVVPIETDGSSDRAFGLYTDITAQKQRQKRLEILNRVLRHDLRNGMNIIDGCAELLADTVDDDGQEHVETIRGRTNELIGLAEKTRAVERVLDREGVAAGPIDLADAIERAISRLETAHPDVEVTASLPDRRFARADEYLQMALFQVLENAVEHNDRPRPTIDVTLRDGPDDESLTVAIADDGPGMPDEERELLEGDREITQLRHASGLGLWLVNWVVTQAGGHLSFSDNDPRGTVVTLEVPRADAESIGSASDEPATSD